jgi:hypothetical protein
VSSTAPSSRNPIEATRRVAEHMRRLARLEVELKTIVLKRKAKGIGIGAGLGLLALLLSPLVVLFALATVAAVLATTMEVWLAILIVTGILLVLVGGLAGAALLLTKKATAKGNNDGS